MIEIKRNGSLPELIALLTFVQLVRTATSPCIIVVVEFRFIDVEVLLKSTVIVEHVLAVPAGVRFKAELLFQIALADLRAAMTIADAGHVQTAVELAVLLFKHTKDRLLEVFIVVGRCTWHESLGQKNGQHEVDDHLGRIHFGEA